MQFAIWLVGLMCHLSTLVRDTLPHRLHPKQGRIRFMSDSLWCVYDPSLVCVCIPASLGSSLNSLPLFHSSESLVKQLSSYEIVTPLRVNDFGESFPHKLHYRRRRRSLSDHLSGLRLHYRVDAFGERFHLNLTAHSGFLAPSYTVVHLGAEESNGTERSDMRHCFFRGHVNGRSDFPAVFSLCTGLVSISASVRTPRASRCPSFHPFACMRVLAGTGGGVSSDCSVAQRRRGGEPARAASLFLLSSKIWLLGRTCSEMNTTLLESSLAKQVPGKQQVQLAINTPVDQEGITAYLDLGVWSVPIT